MIRHHWHVLVIFLLVVIIHVVIRLYERFFGEAPTTIKVIAILIGGWSIISIGLHLVRLLVEQVEEFARIPWVRNSLQFIRGYIGWPFRALVSLIVVWRRLVNWVVIKAQRWKEVWDRIFDTDKG